MAQPTNTIAGMSPARISKLTLDALQTMHIPLNLFTTDLSADIKDSGESVTTRFVTNPTVSNFAAVRTAQNSVTTARTVTLNNYKGVDVGFTDLEVAKSDLAISEQFIQPAITAIFEDVIAGFWALVTVANYSANSLITAANFSAANVRGVQAAMNTAKVPMKRSLVINPTYATTLLTDPAVQAQYAYGSTGPVQDGAIRRIYGFDTYEWNGTIPTNSQNLAGVALNPQASVLAMRQPALPRNWFGQVLSVSDPVSGLTLQWRDFYDNQVQRTQLCAIWGWQIGVTGNLHRIRSGAEA
jgi:hypothetical protein